MNKQPGSITDKGLYILEGASVLASTADILSAKLVGQGATVQLTRGLVETVIKQLREAGIMIDNLLLIVEQRELVKLDKVGNPASENVTRLQGGRRSHRSRRRKS